MTAPEIADRGENEVLDGMLRASHAHTDRTLLVGSSARETHGLLIRVAASLEGRRPEVDGEPRIV